MAKGFMIMLISAVCAVVAIGCAGNKIGDGPTTAGMTDRSDRMLQSQTHLWGYYDVYVDIAEQAATAVLNRQMMFTANVVNFINAKPASLAFHINDTPAGTGYVDVDIDVTITHPFPGMSQYNGYDVRGVFMGDGSASLSYNPDMLYAVLVFDQFMLPDPDGQVGGPDGYTRWFNKPEFSTGVMPLFQYTQGKFASTGFAGTATLNPYKYFADGLQAEDDVWTWLKNHPNQHGRFSSGMSNTRNYYLRFPGTKGVKYGYAILASWSGEAPEMHPSNAYEAVALSVNDSSTVYYAGPSDKGGKIKLDISAWDWDSHPSGGVMDDYRMFLESTVLSGVYSFTTGDMTPIGGGESYSTYHVEIPSDNVQGIDGNEFWVIVEQQGYDYTNDFGVSNLADKDPLAACFRYDLHVWAAEPNEDPICSLMIDPGTPVPAENFSPVPVKFDASLSSDPNGDSLTFEWDFDGDGLYSEIQDDSYTGQPDTPTHGFTSNYDGKAYVRVSDGKGGKAVCSIDVQVIAHPSKNIPLRSGVLAYDLGINQSHGDLLVLYSDGQIWKRTLADWFSTDTQVKPFGGVNNDKRILDVAPNGAFGVIGGQFAIWDESGNFCNWTQGGNGQKDCAAFDSTAGSYANSIACYWGSENSYMGTYYFYIWFQRWYPPYSQGSQQISEKLNSSGSYVIPTGIDQLYWNYIRALETAGDKIWFLEQPDFYCSRWGATGGGISGVWYDHAYFGTGAQGDADNTWYDAKDLTINNVGKLFVLDQLSDGGPRVKEFSEGAPGASLGGFGDSVTISGVPLRIEGSTHDAYVIVLHGTSSPSMISIFMPFEMPG